MRAGRAFTLIELPAVRKGFTLIELLVVIAIIALLIGILLPVLGRARHTARVMQCMSQIRELEIAHWAYMVDHDGSMINAGLQHGILPLSPEVAWINTLEDYYGGEPIVRSPLDESPHWPGEEPVPDTPGVVYRQTSYGLNSFLTDVKQSGRNPWGGPAWTRIDQIRKPTELVHFLVMAFEGEFAGADHPHPEDWDLFGSGGDVVPKIASDQVQIDAAGGPARSFESLSNYGFLDGHAATRRFGDVYTDLSHNHFDPDAVP